ncbi:MAG: ECF RNA polymerase sigma-E factor [Firmicutes bacterium]|nr:ECF RNA polymerase sigma-E factor [candidate division NPL-UPA2 bacterium]MBT9153825.1 ECF RNA polymerase sigma-E factor [candidate division NPL-UPA2 bacterium]MBT9155807.1 ECF RNA polymerase sigma-E factor [candidate division NPL-UPA2 bacterium]
MTELLDRLRRGDKAAFEEMVNKYWGQARRRAVTLTRSWQDAEDLVQESFARAWARVGEFRGDASFSTWLMRIMENHHVDLLRKKKRAPSVSLQTLDLRELLNLRPPAWLDVAMLEKQWEIEDMRKCIDDAFSRLPAAYKKLIVQKDLQRLSYEEMAQQMACSVEAIRCKLYRARKQMRVELARLLGQYGVVM